MPDSAKPSLWLSLVFIGTLLLGIVGGIFLVRHPQIFKSKAHEFGEVKLIDTEGQVIESSTTQTPEIQLEIETPDWSENSQSFNLSFIKTAYAQAAGCCQAGYIFNPNGDCDNAGDDSCWQNNGCTETCDNSCNPSALSCESLAPPESPAEEQGSQLQDDTPETTDKLRISLDSNAVEKDAGCEDNFDPQRRCIEISYADLITRGNRMDWILPEQEGEYTIYLGFISSKGNFKKNSKNITFTTQPPPPQGLAALIDSAQELVDGITQGEEALVDKLGVSPEEYRKTLADLQAVYGDQVTGWIWQDLGGGEARPTPVYSDRPDNNSAVSKEPSLQEAVDTAGNIQAAGGITGAIISNSQNSIIKTFGNVLKTLATNAGSAVFYAGSYMLLNPDDSGESILTLSQAESLLDEQIELLYVNYGEGEPVATHVIKTPSLSEKLEKLGNLDIQYFPDKDPETGEERVVILPKPEVSIYRRALEVSTFSLASESVGRAVFGAGKKIISRISGPIRTLYQKPGKVNPVSGEASVSQVMIRVDAAADGLINQDLSPVIQRRIYQTYSSLKQAFPELKVEVFSTEGSTGVIYYNPNNPSVLYKVYTKGEIASDTSADFIDKVRYAEEEAKKLVILSEEGLAPRLIEYIPPKLTEEESAMLKNPNFGFYGKKANSFPDISLDQTGRTSDSPIIVMEKIDIDSKGFEKLALDWNNRQAQLEKVIEKLEKYDLVPADTDLVVDNRGNLKFIDLGGMAPRAGSQFEDWSIRDEVIRKLEGKIDLEKVKAAGVDPVGETAGSKIASVFKVADLTPIERLETQAILRQKYGLPPYELSSADPAEYIRRLLQIAKENRVDVRYSGEYGTRFFEETGAGGVYQNEFVQIVLHNPSSNPLDSITKLEHELVHSLQFKRYPRMLLKEKEFESYMASGNPDSLVSSPDLVDFLVENSVRIDESLEKSVIEEGENTANTAIIDLGKLFGFSKTSGGKITRQSFQQAESVDELVAAVQYSGSFLNFIGSSGRQYTIDEVVNGIMVGYRTGQVEYVTSSNGLRQKLVQIVGGEQQNAINTAQTLEDLRSYFRQKGYFLASSGERINYSTLDTVIDDALRQDSYSALSSDYGLAQKVSQLAAIAQGNNRLTVNYPLIRSLDAEGARSVLANKDIINSPYDTETFFYALNPDQEIAANTYYKNSDLGTFIVFPADANKRYLRNRFQSSLTIQNENFFVVTIDNTKPGSQLTYDEYLFIRPQDWKLVSHARNVEEAVEVLRNNGITRKMIEQEVIGKLREIINFKKRFFSMQNPVLQDETAWNKFYDEDYLSRLGGKSADMAEDFYKERRRVEFFNAKTFAEYFAAHPDWESLKSPVQLGNSKFWNLSYGDVQKINKLLSNQSFTTFSKIISGLKRFNPFNR